MNKDIKKEDVLLREIVRKDILHCKTLLLVFRKRHDLDDLKKLILKICKKRRRLFPDYFKKIILKIFRKKEEGKETAFSMEDLYIGTSGEYFCFLIPVVRHSEIESLTFYSTERDGEMAVGQEIFFNQPN